MEGDNISGASYSVIICIDDGPVILDSSVSHCISAVEIIPTRVPVGSESRGVPSNFPIPGLWDDPLPLAYDQDELAHWNEKVDYFLHHDASVVALPSFSLFEFLDQYRTCVDIGCIRRMRTDDNALQVQDPPASVVLHLSFG